MQEPSQSRGVENSKKIVKKVMPSHIKSDDIFRFRISLAVRALNGSACMIVTLKTQKINVLHFTAHEMNSLPQFFAR